LKFDSLPGGGIVSSKLMKFTLAAIVVIVCAYYFVSKADPMGKNLFSISGPLLLIIGYSIIAFGLFSDS